MRFLSILLVILALGVSLTVAQEEIETTQFYLGVDLSYVNEMDDCGAVYRANGEVRDAYNLFAEAGANLVRVRLWHNPSWTDYSTYDDVVRSLQRAEEQGVSTLLDFHYSDTWADPSRQNIPSAWEDIDNLEDLGAEVYNYTYNTLINLHQQGLLPDMVQVGNEINSEVMRPEGSAGFPIDWERNAYLINSGIRAVRDISTETGTDVAVIIHVAQPEEVEGWLRAAEQAGVTDFDIIGLSYYTGWSSHTIDTAGNAINQLRHRFGKDILVVETGYPWTFASNNESASNIMNTDFLLNGYPATPEGQRNFMIDLTQRVFNSGGLGVVYWEPAWVSTECRTLWGQGSHWENATFFDFRNDNEVLEGIQFLSHAYEYPIDVQFVFDMPADNRPEILYLRGDFTGMGRRLLQILPDETGQFVLHTRLIPQTDIQYQVYSALPASEETALLQLDCLNDEGMVAVRLLDSATLIYHTNEQCPTLEPR